MRQPPALWIASLALVSASWRPPAGVEAASTASVNSNSAQGNGDSLYDGLSGDDGGSQLGYDSGAGGGDLQGQNVESSSQPANDDVLSGLGGFDDFNIGSLLGGYGSGGGGVGGLGRAAAHGHAQEAAGSRQPTSRSYGGQQQQQQQQQQSSGYQPDSVFDDDNPLKGLAQPRVPTPGIGAPYWQPPAAAGFSQQQQQQLPLQPPPIPAPGEKPDPVRGLIYLDYIQFLLETYPARRQCRPAPPSKAACDVSAFKHCTCVDPPQFTEDGRGNCNLGVTKSDKQVWCYVDPSRGHPKSVCPDAKKSQSRPGYHWSRMACITG